jgi:flavin-binding protein dodecin
MAVARVTKITASSTQGFQQAVDDGLTRAASSLRGITGLKVVSQKAKVENGAITEYRATIEVTFVLD